MISTTEIEEVIEQLKKDKYRRSTQRNYYCVWRVFNQFFIQLDRKPNNWEDRILLFAVYLIKENRKSTTVRSYISAIKAVLADINVSVDENRCLLNSLTRACKLTRDSFSVRLPIQKDMLNVLLNTTYKYHLYEGQPYIAHLYVALFSTAYYRLFRVGELTHSDHVLRVCDVHIASNKDKVMFVLKSSKTHRKYCFPQTVKISSFKSSTSNMQNHLCPFLILRQYLSQCMMALSNTENFFVFRDRSPVMPYHFRQMLKNIIRQAGMDSDAYTTHSLRSGRAVDLMNLGVSIETIKKMGRWKLNAIYSYLI